MITSAFRRAAPIAAIAFSVALSGCAYLIDDVMEFDGVALSDLDTSGDAPSRIMIAGPDDVVITEGEAWAVTVDGDGGAAEAVRFKHDDDRLTIGRESGVFDGRGKAIVRITMPPPSELSIAGSGSITAPTMASDASLEIKGSGDITVEEIAADTVEFDIKGSGDVAVAALEANKVEVDIKGSGDVRAAGKADRLEVDIKGRGKVDLAELTADEASVDIKGSGDVEFASDGRVTADIKGSGDILVTGDATCSQDVKGSGSLRCEPAKRSAAKDSDEAAGE